MLRRHGDSTMATERVWGFGEKARNGAKVHKVYATARTPYQRLLKAGELYQYQGRYRTTTLFDEKKPRLE